MRRKLVQEIRNKGIVDEKVLNAMNEVPRHLFFDNAFLEFAYQDQAFPIGSGQTISQPYTVAFQSQLLDVQEKDKILEVGTGSGYQCSVLVAMGARMFSIERHQKLHEKSKQILRTLNYKARLLYGDGYKGMPGFAPFDKILITAAAPSIPESLLQQLKVGGYLVVPVGDDKNQEMLRLKKINDANDTETETFGKFQFVPMLPDKARG